MTVAGLILPSGAVPTRPVAVVLVVDLPLGVTLEKLEHTVLTGITIPLGLRAWIRDVQVKELQTAAPAGEVVGGSPEGRGFPVGGRD